MKKKLYLHIGFHKTGTSSIQEYLDYNRDSLLNQGIYYLKSLDSKFPGNVDLSWAFNKNPPKWSNFNPEKAEQVKSFYNKQLNVNLGEILIISSEYFCILERQPNSLKELKSFLIDFDVRIVSYVRDPMEFLISLYSHALRANAVSYDLKTYLSNHYNFFAADFHERLKPWVNIFGREKMIVKKYSPNGFFKENIIDDFFNAIGAEVNVSISQVPYSNVGIHVWLNSAYMNIASSKMDDENKNELQSELLKISKSLPKVNKAKYLLSEQDINIYNKVYHEMKLKINKEYNIDL